MDNLEFVEGLFKEVQQRIDAIQRTQKFMSYWETSSGNEDFDEGFLFGMETSSEALDEHIENLKGLQNVLFDRITYLRQPTKPTQRERLKGF